MAYYNTYRDQLASLYHGHALWVPDPSELYDRVRVGDVGYVKQGHFLRMFNVLLPANDGAQEYGVPEGFVPLNVGPFKNIRTLNLFQGDYCSNTVTVNHEDKHQAAGPDEDTGASFKCRSNKGAFLSLPLNGIREDAIRTKAFETYIRKHCDSWLEFASANEIDVRLEDIILVTGCDLTSSWAMAVFVNSLDPEISLNVRVSDAGSARFRWTPTNQPHHNEPNQNVVRSHCVFIRGFRAKRILPFFNTLKAAAEPRPDNPDNEPESSIELLREPILPDYRDPLIGILDYIVKQRPNQEIAIAHEDNLKTIEGVDVLTADAVEKFLDENKFPLQTDEGVALLANGDKKGVPEEETMTFYARADVGDKLLPLMIHPALMKYFLKFDISQSPDHDFGLPTEEYFSSAVHPPVHILILENEQGLPQNIEVQASDMESEIGVTVEDVLKTISVYLRTSSSQREWVLLNEGNRREVEGALKDQARTEEGSGDLRQIDYLRSRNRLQVFPKYPVPEGDDGISQPLPKIREAAAEVPRRAAEEAARIEEESAMRLATAQEEAKTHVQLYLQSFLSSDPPSDEELSTTFLTCAEACKVVGLEFAAVLQEPLIEEQLPIYWAILNRPTAYGTVRATYDRFVFALLAASQPLSPSTHAAVRLACTTTSDNKLLQRLFRHVPELSPLSPSDAKLLAPLNETDVVEVMETREGTGTFVAHIRIPRLRVRMRASKCVVVEFVASERIWALRFSVVVETSMDGRTESKWLLSLELGEQSQVVAVDADLFIEGSTLQPLDNRDFEDPLLCVSFSPTTSELWPGRDNGITVRLDDGPMGPHLLNESSILVDSHWTLCAQLNVRLARPALPALVRDTSSTTSPPRSPNTPFSETSHPSPSSIKFKKAKERPKDPKVSTPLWRGGW